MLLVVGAQPAVVRAAVLHLACISQRDRAWLVELRLRCIGLRVSVNQRFKAAVLGTALAHEHLAVAQQDLGIDRPPALRANAASQLMKDVVRILLGGEIATLRVACLQSDRLSVVVAHASVPHVLSDITVSCLTTLARGPAHRGHSARSSQLQPGEDAHRRRVLIGCQWPCSVLALTHLRRTAERTDIRILPSAPQPEGA